MVARKQKHKGIIVGIGSMCVYIEIHNFAFQFCKVAKRAAISDRAGPQHGGRVVMSIIPTVVRVVLVIVDGWS